MAGILALAVVLRLWALDVKPAHFDEGVNGWFADEMAHTGYYRYDPTNYHGPLHMYAVFVSQSLLGRDLWALRLPAVLASVLCVAMVLSFRKFFGAWPANVAGLLMAVSPAYVFYGRYSIHESWLVLGLLAVLYGILGLWEFGRRRDLWWLGGGAALCVLTKETYAIHFACFALAGATLWLLGRVIPSRPALSPAAQEWDRRDLAKVSAAAVVVIVIFYSGFLLDFSALPGLWTTFLAWFQTGVEAGGHEKTSFDLVGPLNYYWLALMGRYEWGALAGVVAGLLYIRPSDAKVRYTAICGAGALVAYSLVPYKTPWCVISLLWPFYFVVGSALFHLTPWPRRIVLVVLAGHGLWASVDLNYRKFDDENEPYVYVQTFREVADGINPPLELARRDPRFRHQPGAIVMGSYYPLPWIFGDFTSVGYYTGESVPAQLDSAFVLADESLADKVQSALVDDYYRRPFRLRSGADKCVAFFRVREFSPLFDGAPPDVLGNRDAARPPAETALPAP